MDTRMWLRSDNAAGVDPAILDAIAACNAGVADSYGDDPHSRRLDAVFADLFEHEVHVFPVASGTAANSLALATLAGPLRYIACHRDAHAYRNESGATTFMSGGAHFLPVEGDAGLIDPAALARQIDGLPSAEHGAMRAGAVTVTQLTEHGTAYGADHLQEIGRIAKARGLKLHLDGARFANALAAGHDTAAQLTWRAGVDAMSFGATKNGTMYADAVLFFDGSLAGDFRQRLKRSGHSLSKTRFLAAQLLAYVDQGLWLRNAGHANAMAARIASLIARIPGARFMARVDGNMIFASIPVGPVERLRQQGFELRPKGAADNGDPTFRLVTSFATMDEEVSRFQQALGL